MEAREAKFGNGSREFTINQSLRINETFHSITLLFHQIWQAGFNLDATNFAQYVSYARDKHFTPAKMDGCPHRCLFNDVLKLLDHKICMAPLERQRRHKKCLKQIWQAQEELLINELDIAISLRYALLFNEDFEGWKELQQADNLPAQEKQNKHLQKEILYSEK